MRFLCRRQDALMARIGVFLATGREGCAVPREVARGNGRRLGFTASVRVAIAIDRAVFLC